MRRLLVLVLFLTLPAWAEPTPQDRASQALHAVLDMSQRRAIQFGNYREAVRILRYHAKVAAGRPDYVVFLHRMECLSLLAEGRNFEAEQLCQQWRAGDVVMQSLLRGLALALSSRPDELKAELDQLDGPKLGSLHRFVRGSLHFHLDWLSGQPGDVAARFRANLAELKSYRSDREFTTGEPWLLEQGLKLWEGPLLTLIHTENQDARAKEQLINAYFEGQQRLHELAQQNLSLKTLNPEYQFMVIENLLTSYEDYLSYLWLDEASRQQPELQKMLDELDQVVTPSSQTFAEDQRKLAGMLKPLVEGVTFEGQPYPLDLCVFETRSGLLARLQSRFLIIQLRSLWNLSEGKLDRAAAARAQDLLKQAAAEQLRLRGTYLGLQDARLDQVELLLRQQEQGWQAQAQTLTSTLLEEARQQRFPPVQVAALALQARLALALGQLERAGGLIDQAVALHERGVLGFDLSAAAVVEKRRRNSRLYRLQSEIKMRRGDTEGALAGLERERQARLELERGLPPDQSSELARREALEAELRQPGQATDLLEHLRQSDWANASLQAIRPKLTSLTQMRRLLPPSTSVLVYLPLEKELRIVVVRPSGVLSRGVPVGRLTLDQEVRQFRSLILRAGTRELPKHSRRLYDWLIGPVAGDIAQDETLAVVASGSLSYLPFAALTDPHNAYLGRSKVCVNLAGVSDILRLGGPRPPAGRHLLALANPDGTLPASETEVRGIARLFPQARVYLRGQAERLALHWEKAPDLLHIATHGILDPGHPRASYLVLAGRGETARLRVPDIYNLPLKGTDLVVLSACETALGEYEPGSEITSLADAFQFAGSRSVIASLWSVEDNSTSALMQSLYRHRPGHSLGKALQLAQLELMDKRATAHPFFWAPFILLGDFR